MADTRLTLFCLVDGDTTSHAFPLSASTTFTVGELKELIKSKKTNDFSDVDADKLTLWRVSIPITDDDDESPILLSNVANNDKKKLGPATDVAEVFSDGVPRKTVNVVVQRPPA
ncbi:hypothetical protein BGZ58_002744, partial [Dissophora ornata]